MFDPEDNQCAIIEDYLDPNSSSGATIAGDSGEFTNSLGNTGNSLSPGARLNAGENPIDVLNDVRNSATTDEGILEARRRSQERD